MIDISPSLKFTIEDIHKSSEQLLGQNPDPVVRFRLLREVLRVSPQDSRLVEAKNAMQNSRWIRQLLDAQLPDGSYGRFHTQDTKVKTVFRTTEEAIDRSFSLGLEPGDAPLAGVHQYILNVLQGQAHVTDRDEKSEAWPLGIKLILAGRLAQIDPTDRFLSVFWVYMEEVTEQAFCSGSYHLEDEAAAYPQLSGVNYPQGFLESQHCLWILTSRTLPQNIDGAVVNWMWNKPDGIRYLRVPLQDPQPRQMGCWLRSMNILARFASWKGVATGTLNRLWQQRDEQGLWDFGNDVAGCVDFPLSENWRHKINRKMDYSTAMLALLRKAFD